MIRSNSSSGVTTFHTPSSPTASKFTRNRNYGRNNNNENVSTGLTTFRVGQNQSYYRGGSPSRSLKPSLANLEFPPPPTDLPPPPEEFDNTQEVINTSSTATVIDLKKKITILSPLTSRKQVSDENDGDVSNLEPSVKEASCRFGVNLKKREPSVESCSSTKAYRDENKEKSPIRTSLSVSSSQEERSPLSAGSDAPPIGSPLNSTISSSALEDGKLFKFICVHYDKEFAFCILLGKEDEHTMNNSADDDQDNKLSKVFKKNQVVKEMELKLVAEIKERAEQKSKNVSESPQDVILSASTISQDPVTQLVTELSQSLNLDHAKRKTEMGPKKKEDEVPPIISFKSRLRKVDKKEDETETYKNIGESEGEGNKRESVGSCDSGNLKLDDCDDKRKSTGSISSLKKLWEPKESDSSGNTQLSPKLTIKNSKDDEQIDSTDSEKIIKSEKRNWPPSNEEKPVIPIKPPLKSVKPAVTARPAGSAIYATPIAPKPPISAKPATVEPKIIEEHLKSDQTSKGEKGNILEISQALESTLNSIKSNPNVSSATWLQLSDKIGLLHGSCMDYADNVVPAHTKFHFRELLTRLETQARQLRSAGSRNSTENARCLIEVNNTIKDVVNVVFR